MGICDYGAQKTFELNFNEMYQKCPLCENKYSDILFIPKILPCGHTICFECLIRLKKKYADNNSVMKCPFDRMEYPYQEFPTSFTILKSLNNIRRKDESKLILKRYNNSSEYNNNYLYSTEANLMLDKTSKFCKDFNGLDDVSAIEKSCHNNINNINNNNSSYMSFLQEIDGKKDKKMNESSFTID